MGLTLQFEKGHIFVQINDKLWLIDTGALTSFGNSRILNIGEKQFELDSDIHGYTADTVSQYVGIPCAGLIGVDILNRFDVIFDVTNGKLTVFTAELSISGQSFHMEDFMGIPIINAHIGDNYYRMIFDTGAQISYFQDDSLFGFPPAGVYEDFHFTVGEYQTENLRCSYIAWQHGPKPPLRRYAAGFTSHNSISRFDSGYRRQRDSQRPHNGIFSASQHNDSMRGEAIMNFTILLIVVEYIALTYIFGLLYKIIGEKSSAYIQRNFGWTGYCILGTIGVTYHELSHLIAAVLFRHKINEVRLFIPFRGKVDGTLGYVNHSWERKSIYQKIGNFFIGTAPMFFGAGLLFIVLRVAYPSRFSNITEINEIPNLLIFAFSDAFTPTNLLTMWTPFVFLIVIFICPHMHMSRADVKGSASGAIVLTAAAFILSLATAVLPDDVVMQIKSAMNTFVAYYIYALILGLIISVIMALCFGSLSIIRGKR